MDKKIYFETTTLSQIDKENASEYQILDVRPMAFSTTENEEQNTDTTILNFNVKFQVDVLFRQ